MSGIIGKKVGMTSFFGANGKYVPCTIIEAGPCVITQVKTKESDGYEALQLAFDDKKEKHTPKAMQGHFKKANTEAKRKVMEFRTFEEAKALGDVLTVDQVFAEGDLVDISGITKGKGFQGVVKRHGFSGVGASTHGQHDRQRAPGSLGNSSDASRVFKGMRMAGRDGGRKRKTTNLEVLKVIADKNLLIIRGSVAGAKGSYLVIEK